MLKSPLFFLSSLFILVTFLSMHFSIASEKKILVNENPKYSILNDFQKESLDKEGLLAIKKKALQLGGAAVPYLVEVMKSNAYPDKSRWMATFLLGEIMGGKASPYLSKYLEHPHWVMRMASLKTLLALKEKQYASLYVKKLSDDSLMVRMQALENIKDLEMKEKAKDVWQMIYQKQNYQDVKGKLRRMPIINQAIRTVGDLEYSKAKHSMLTMIQKKQYDDLFIDLDYALEKVTKLKSPTDTRENKKIFWGKLLASEIN